MMWPQPQHTWGHLGEAGRTLPEGPQREHSPAATPKADLSPQGCEWVHPCCLEPPSYETWAVS